MGGDLDCKLDTIQINDYLVSVCGSKEFELDDIISINERYVYEILEKFVG